MRKYLIVILFFAVGCTSTLTDEITTSTGNYDKIVWEDGINKEEAFWIAQRQLIKNNVVQIYDLSAPLEFEDKDNLPDQEQYWFIYFEERSVGSIEYYFMVIINKHTGKVKFAKDWKVGMQAVLEAALLKK